MRAQRLRADIKDLSYLPESEIGDQLDGLLRSGKLADFMAHTVKAVELNPHILLAYAWVFYMALFSGGRFLRAALIEAGGEKAYFWKRQPLPVSNVTCPRRNSPPEVDTKAMAQFFLSSEAKNGVEPLHMSPGLRFFNFAGDKDGDDIKVEFKKRFSEVETLLTRDEKDHIIAEADRIFNFMVEIVLDMDGVMARVQNPKEVRDLRRHPMVANRDGTAVPDKVLIPAENQEKKAPGGRCPSKDPTPFMSESANKHLRSFWTDWLTSIVPMALCIVLTSWYYAVK